MNTRILIFWLGIVYSICLLSCAPVLADLSPPAQTLPIDASYLVQPQDVLSVSVVGFPDLTVLQTTVLTDGSVTLPLIGSVNVAGLTPAQVVKKLTKLWSKYVIDPSITLSLVQVHPEYVTFSGWVAKPGVLPYHSDYHVIEALADDGGVMNTEILPGGAASGAGDLSQVTVTNALGEKVALDLTNPQTKAGTDVDVLLNPGDVVYVPELHAEYSVVGEVGHPGSYPYITNMTVLDALTTSGGVLGDAALADATLYHNGVDSPIDLNALLRHGDMTKNIILSPGDRLTVPQGDRTYVYGAVNHPGYYTYVPGDHILDALNAAGGPQSAGIGGQGTPDLAKVHLIRKDTINGVPTAEIQIVDLQKFLNKGEEKYNVAVEPGDVLYIPTKGHKFSLSDLDGPLSGLESAVYIHNLTQ